jgi:hypothetical protein
MKLSSRALTFGIEPQYFLPLLVTYLVAHAGMFLILNSVFWDDWTLFDQAPQTLLNTFTMGGSVFAWVGHMHIALLSIGPWVYRILTLVLMFLSGVLLWKVLERHMWIHVEARFAIVLLFLVLPFNWARVALIDLPYTLCYFSFFLGWYLIAKNRWLALCFFLISFNTNSLLVFYLLPIADWYFRENDAAHYSSLAKWGRYKLDFLALPFVYWVIKQIYFRPYGMYAGYNEHFSLRGLISTPRFMATDFVHLHVDVCLFAFMAVACMFVLPRFTSVGSSPNDKRLLIAGCVALACALFPYWLLRLAPTFFEWGSRHQLLIPLGASVLCVWALSYLKPDARYVGLAVLTGVSLAIHLQVYSELADDWEKQQEIISLLSQSASVRDANLVIFQDRTQDARRRSFRFYEWNGLLRQAFRDERRFALAPDQINAYANGDFDKDFIPAFDAQEHTRTNDARRVFVTIEYEDTRNGEKDHNQLTHPFGRPHYRILVDDNGCDANTTSRRSTNLNLRDLQTAR